MMAIVASQSRPVRSFISQSGSRIFDTILWLPLTLIGVINFSVSKLIRTKTSRIIAINQTSTSHNSGINTNRHCLVGETWWDLRKQISISLLYETFLAEAVWSALNLPHRPRDHIDMREKLLVCLGSTETPAWLSLYGQVHRLNTSDDDKNYFIEVK